ncbi:MAG: PP0621 family protein [Pseudomonadota bacterium]
MKYLLILALVVVVYMWWRNGRIAQAQSQTQARPGAAPQAAGAQDMVCCPVCSVHLPRGEAVAGGDGRLYCSQEHRLRAPGG